jgi:putative transposase
VRNDGKNLSEVTLDDSREALVDIYAYCLMPNHFHLLIREKTDGGISRFMQKLTTAYTMYFNMRYQRTGALFQGTYKASWVGNDRYLLYLISYIHLNPVKLIEPEWKNVGISDKNKVLRYLRSYRYSSFIDYCGVQRLEGCLIDKAALPTPSDQSDYLDKMISDWFTYQG